MKKSVKVEQFKYNCELLHNILEIYEEVSINNLCKKLIPNSPLVILHNSMKDYDLNMKQETVEIFNKEILKKL